MSRCANDATLICEFLQVVGTTGKTGGRTPTETRRMCAVLWPITGEDEEAYDVVTAYPC